MGLIRFLVPAPSDVSAQAHERAFATGIDQVPWRCDARRIGDEIHITRGVQESGNFHIPWIVPGRGELMLSTCTLVERVAPYLFAVELARGKVNQLRNQAADWQAIGLVVDEPVWNHLRRATEHFAKAAVGQTNPAQAITDAQLALQAALDGADALADCYVEQALAVRRRQNAQLPTVLAAELTSTPHSKELGETLLAAVNAVVVPLAWREIEAQEGNYQWTKYDKLIDWCVMQKRPVIGGPLIELESQSLPDWLCLWEGDFENTVSVVRDFIETVISRYRGKVAAWQCASRVNTGRALSLGEEERLRLAVSSIEAVRQADPNTPVILRFDQPWAEYMARTDVDLSPLHFADALVRAGLGLSAIGLDLSIGYAGVGSTMRDRLDFGKLIDLWSCLGLPLFVCLTAPSAMDADPLAWRTTKPDANAVVGGWSEAAQNAFVETYVPLLLAKPSVQAVVWNQWSDAEPHEFPHGGLVNRRAAVKPVLRSLGALRKSHLRYTSPAALARIHLCPSGKIVLASSEFVLWPVSKSCCGRSPICVVDGLPTEPPCKKKLWPVSRPSHPRYIPPSDSP